MRPVEIAGPQSGYRHNCNIRTTEWSCVIRSGASADVVLDGSDNFATRFEVNDACVANARCLISAAAIRFEGQLAVFGPDYSQSPCYRCLYTDADESLDNCSGNGVLSPVPGIIGTLAASECLKVMAGIDPNNGRLSLFDAMSSEWQSLAIRKNADCPTCGVY